jgi:serine/threonine protein kinase
VFGLAGRDTLPGTLRVMLSTQDDLVARAGARLGTVLKGKYRLDSVLGVGGMAAVFVAVHLRNANRVAVKILHRELAFEPSVRARFLREGYAANSVGHPGTVRILDDDIAADGSVFLVMDLLDGETLDARWERNGRRLPVAEVVTFMVEVLDVLAAAHDKGVVHRDLKPENLFVTLDGRVRVLDFGVARLREASPTRTSSGAVLGTPAYMPPEQALGHASDVDALSDVWAVGATAFSLLSGRLVHEGETAEEVRVQAATNPAPSMASVAPDVPEPIAKVIDRALAFEKRDRWASARAMQEELTRARDMSHHAMCDDDGDPDGKTEIAPPPQMTLRGSGIRGEKSSSEVPTLALPLQARSTVAGVVSNSEARRLRSRQKHVLIGAGGGALLALVPIIGVVRAVMVGPRGPRPALSASASASVPHAAAPAAPIPASATTVPNASMIASGEVSVISVEALPKAVTPLPPIATPIAASVPPVRAATPPPPASAAPHPSASVRRDPLAPDGF